MKAIQIHLVVASVAMLASLNANSATQSDCNELIQAWALNFSLEEVCAFDGGVASKLKAIGRTYDCQSQLTKKQTADAFKEVLIDLRSDYKKWGKVDFCNGLYLGYREMQDSIGI